MERKYTWCIFIVSDLHTMFSFPRKLQVCILHARQRHLFNTWHPMYPKKYIKVIGQILLKVNTFKTMLNTSLVYTLVYWRTMRYRITVQNHGHLHQCEIQRCKQKYRKKRCEWHFGTRIISPIITGLLFCCSVPNVLSGLEYIRWLLYL